MEALARQEDTVSGGAVRVVLSDSISSAADHG